MENNKYSRYRLLLELDWNTLVELSQLGYDLDVVKIDDWAYYVEPDEKIIQVISNLKGDDYID